MSETFPVLMEVQRADGSVEKVRVGSAVKDHDGFTLRLGELSIGGTPMAASAAPRRSSPAASSGGGGEPTVFPPYGRSKGAPIHGASTQDLEYYANGARRSLADPSKARWHDKERALLAVIEAEIARQQGGSGDLSDGIPPPGDEDAPF